MTNSARWRLNWSIAAGGIMACCWLAASLGHVVAQSDETVALRAVASDTASFDLSQWAKVFTDLGVSIACLLALGWFLWSVWRFVSQELVIPLRDRTMKAFDAIVIQLGEHSTQLEAIHSTLETNQHVLRENAEALRDIRASQLRGPA